MNVVESNQQVLDDLQNAFKQKRKFMVFIESKRGIITSGATTDQFTAQVLLGFLRFSVENKTTKVIKHLDQIGREEEK